MLLHVFSSISVILLISSLTKKVSSFPCASRDYGDGNIVCVCNSTYCDTLNVPPSLNSNTAYVTESSKQGARFKYGLLKMGYRSSTSVPLDQNTTVNIQVNPTEVFQEIIGFGGAFTDSAGINFMSLPEKMRFDIIHSYYSVDGSEYNVGRVPIASCDFSTRAYSYDDTEGDMELTNFALAQEDMLYKIPFLLKAKSVSTQPLLLFASAWSPPGWMKTNNKMQNGGFLKGDTGGEYYQTWANYFVKFLQEYEKNNLTFWGLTTENEPSAGYVPFYPWQSLGFSPRSEGIFVAKNLGPALQKAGYGVDKVKLMIMDDQRLFLPLWAKWAFSNKEAASYVSGIAFHWYKNNVAPATVLDKTHSQFPDKFLLATEACEGSESWQKIKVSLGDWSRAEAYAHDIMEDLLHWTTGWVDWNLALDLQGGPNWVQNFVDAPIIVNASAGEFYKQPMYFALAHFSKFVKSGSKRVGTSITGSDLEVAAFQIPNDSIVLIALNRNANELNLQIQETGLNRTIEHVIPGNSIQTYVWTVDSNDI